MEAKEKAIDLTADFYDIKSNEPDYGIDWEMAKKCVLIAVELHLEELSKMKLIFSDREIHYKYWQEVKNEINKL